MTKQLWKWSFTWNMKDGWDEKQFSADHVRLTDTMKKYSKKWIFQLERGTENGRLHYQGYLSLLKKSTQGSLAKCIQTELEGFHLAPCSAVGEASLKTYCMKSDTKVSGPWSDKEQADQDAEKLKPYRSNCEFDPAEMYADILSNPRPFQRSLTNMTDPDLQNNRTIIWVGDMHGNLGKTHWANYMSDVKGAEFHTYGKTTDVANVITQRPRSRLYIFNLPRAKPKDAILGDLLNLMEQLKDGRVCNYKYKGDIFKLRPPHVVCLANYFPTFKEAKDLASMDRWKFFEITPDYKLKPYVIHEHVDA